MTKTLKYIIQKEDKYYVSQCLNVDVSSFGNTVQEAKENLNEALMLYFEEKAALFTISIGSRLKKIHQFLLNGSQIHCEELLIENYTC